MPNVPNTQVDLSMSVGEDQEFILKSSPPPSSQGTSSKAALIATCVLVPTFGCREIGLTGFPGSLMVLGETLTYFFGGLSLAVMWEGLHGMRRCFQPLRYLAFMPASLAYSWAGFMTYPAIKGFGASQFYLLAQLRVAIIAVFMRWASRVRQPATVWISLTQLVLGMVVLVWYKAGAVAGEVGCHFLPAAALQAVPTSESESSEDQVSFMLSFAAMVGVIVTSAFGTLYLERQLKASSKDGDVPTAAPVEDLDPSSPFLPLRVALSVSCVVARGALNGSVLKKLDALTKGLIDVTAIVLCTVIQVLAQGRQTDVTAMGLQMMMLLSVLGFVSARQVAPPIVDEPPLLPLRQKSPRVWPWEEERPIPKAFRARLSQDLVCGNDCGGIAWDFEVQQLTFGGGIWGAFFGLGLALSITGATSNVDSWRMFLEITCLRISTSKFFLVLDFSLAAITCIHFCVRTYTESLTMVGFVLEAIAAVYFFGLMLPFWGFAHCEGILSGLRWMLIDRAIPDALLIGAVASLPVAEHQGKKTWFAPSWLAAIHLLRSWGKLLRVYKINLEMFRNQIIDAIVSTAFKVYLMAMMMLTFEPCFFYDPKTMTITHYSSQRHLLKTTCFGHHEKWNTISSLYFILTSVATVGFGDLAPVTSLGRMCTVFAIYFGLAWVATVAYRSLQILAVNQTGGGFFEPILHSKCLGSMRIDSQTLKCINGLSGVSLASV
eukprot:g8905.t1